MKTLKFTEHQDWLDARVGKVTGTRLKDIIVKRGTGKKIGFYELIAERVAVQPDEEDPMERGKRLEQEALQKFSEQTKKEVNTNLVLWVSDFNESVALSPDGFMGDTEAVEVKCLSSARHLEAWLTKEVPSEYVDQTIHYFIVNEKLEKLFVVFYDPRIPAKDFFFLEIKREDVEEKVKEYTKYLKTTIEEINKIVIELTF